MAFAPLILQESLRPWQAAGVTHFLREPVAAADSGEEPPLPAASPAEAGQSPPAPLDSLPPRTAWPELWERQVARMPEQPLVVWTYVALGRDLCCAPDSERRERLRALLHPLRLPRGASAFLPCLLPDFPLGAPVPPKLDNADFIPNPPVFWAAMREIGPGLLVVFGLKALDAIWPGHGLRLYQQAAYRGAQLIFLPDIFPERAEAAALPLAAVSAYLSTVFSALRRE